MELFYTDRQRSVEAYGRFPQPLCESAYNTDQGHVQ
jgi:hypothetical protein